MARSLVIRFSKARRKGLGLVILICAILAVPVAYDVWFAANFGLDARVFRYAPSGYSAVLLLQPDTPWRLWVLYSSAGNPGSENLGMELNPVGGGEPSYGAPGQPFTISRTAGTRVSVLFSYSWAEMTPKPHGFYWLRITEMCTGLPVAIGLSASQVNASDFPGLGIAPNCPAEFFSTTIQAYAGMEITYVQSTNLRYP